MTSKSKIFFLNLHYRRQLLFAQTKTSLRLTTLQKLLFVWSLKEVTINDLLHNLFSVLSQKVLIAQTRLNVFTEDNKMLLTKTTLQQLELI